MDHRKSEGIPEDICCFIDYTKAFDYVKVKVKSLSRVRLFATPWTVAYQAPPSMGFSRPEYWSGLPFPSPGDRPDPGIEPRSPTLEAGALPSEPPGNPCVKWTVSPSVVSDSAIPWTAWNSPGKNTGVGCHFLLQGIVPTQELNMGLLHCRQILYHLRHQGSLLVRNISKYKNRST